MDAMKPMHATPMSTINHENNVLIHTYYIQYISGVGGFEGSGEVWASSSSVAA